ncbi:MAG TPA: response regulator [Polyangia bacterium]|nr:response regulator [Polyangia bacterium]
MADRVFVLEDDDDLRTTLCDLILRTTGRECIGLRTLAEIRAQRAAVLGCVLGILDVNLGSGEPSGLDAFAWLRTERFAGRIVFLTGHASTHPLVARAAQMGEATVLYKPIDTTQLLALLK